jgi:hypothetical protein
LAGLSSADAVLNGLLADQLIADPSVQNGQKPAKTLLEVSQSS